MRACVKYHHLPRMGWGLDRSAVALTLALCLSSQVPAADGNAAEPATMQSPLASRSLLLDGAVTDSHLVVVGERGHILTSTDDGASWRQAQVPVRVLLTAVHMHDTRTGWAVGHDAVILRTGDGGASWQLVHHAPEEERPLLDVWFRDGLTGFAVGAYGYFLATEDGGDTWTSRTISEDDFHLNALLPVAPHQLFIAAEAGVIYRSGDGGDSWQELPSPYTGSWFGALALEGGQLLLLGIRGHLFRSVDDGNNWIQIPTATTATLTSAVQLQSGAVLITGLEGTLLVSVDSGHSVSLEQLSSRQGVSTALPLADGNVLLIGEFGVLRLPWNRS